MHKLQGDQDRVNSFPADGGTGYPFCEAVGDIGGEGCGPGGAPVYSAIMPVKPAPLLRNHLLLDSTDLDEVRELTGRLWGRHSSEKLGRDRYRLRFHHAAGQRLSASFVDCSARVRVRLEGACGAQTPRAARRRRRYRGRRGVGVCRPGSPAPRRTVRIPPHAGGGNALPRHRPAARPADDTAGAATADAVQGAPGHAARDPVAAFRAGFYRHGAGRHAGPASRRKAMCVARFAAVARFPTAALLGVAFPSGRRLRGSRRGVAARPRSPASPTTWG